MSGVTADQVINECQAATLAAQGALANPQELGMPVKLIPGEIGNDPNLPFVSEILEGFNQECTHVFRIIEFAYMPGTQAGSQVKLGPGYQPVGKMVSFRVKDK